ncbi:MlaD family protein [Actinomycetospora endophytica]|uniref:MlaD family protein n=1 Tax=Actinomycetospora endophytica TaxID=2291215 RepID=A0ABS8PIY1_9PSEU|nr:MlaD family protein [Actinomycetospora endophytica]MCD2198242.1 MlaD family protein [Actinomycetospora endophytica]
MKSPRRISEQIRNVPGLGSNILAVVLVTIVGIVATAFLLPHYDISVPWKPEYHFAAVVEKAPGMKDDSKHKVTIAGIQVGTVKQIDTQRDGTARIEMAIDPTFKIYKNAHLEVRTFSPINDVYVAVEPGDPASGELGDDGTIPEAQTSRFIQPAEVLNKLDGRTQQAVTSLVTQADVALRDAPRNLPAGLDQTDQTLNSLKPVAQSLQTRRDTLQKLITNLSQISTAVGHNDQRLASMITSLQQTLAVLSSRDDQLNQTLGQLPGLRGDLDHSMTSVTTLTGQLNPTLNALHAASDALPPALEKLTDTVGQAGDVVDAAGPVVSKARPVVSDLRAVVPDAHSTLNDLKPVTGLLPDATSRLVPWLPNLQAFVYQTSSAFSVSDANGGLGRAQITFDLTNPAGGLKPMPDAKPNGGRTGQ